MNLRSVISVLLGILDRRMIGIEFSQAVIKVQIMEMKIQEDKVLSLQIM
jgi:hypothetical protein